MKAIVLAAVSFTVVGVPMQQGSKTVVRGIAVESNRAKLRPWRALLTDAAIAVAHPEPMDGPLRVVLDFRLPRPQTAKKAYWCQRRPDWDKLSRAVCDALTDSGLIADDARIAHAETLKRYPLPHEQVGVTVHVSQIDEGLVP